MSHLTLSGGGRYGNGHPAAVRSEVLTHTVVPPNDGGLALGQAVVATLIVAASQHQPSVAIATTDD